MTDLLKIRLLPPSSVEEGWGEENKNNLTFNFPPPAAQTQSPSQTL